MGRVVEPNEVLLNSVRYPIQGRVRPSLISQFPGKIVVGDYSKETEQVASSWIISDQRGGILIEDMDETTDANKCWWSTCDLRYKGHIILPPLATDCGRGQANWAASTVYALTNLVQATTYNNRYYECTTAGTSGGTEPTWGTTVGGTTADNTVVWTCRAEKDVYKIFELGGAVYACYDKYLRVFDNTNTDFNDVEKVFSYNPTDIIVFQGAVFAGFDESDAIWQRAIPTTGVIDNADFDDWTAGAPDDWTAGGGGTLTANTDPTYIHSGEYSALLTGVAAAKTLTQSLPFSTAFRGKQFTATAYGHCANAGNYIRIDDGVGTTDTAFDDTFQQKSVVRTLNAAATKLDIVSNSPHTGTAKLYVDSVGITMTDSSPWIQPTAQTAKFFTIWGSLLFKINNAGELSYTADGVTWYASGTIPAPFGNVTGLGTYRDASGNSIIYARTEKGLFAHDYDNSDFIQTELALPSHPTAGLGATHWHAGYYVSAGLDILKYVAASTATITSVGLDREAGLPAEYQGEVTSITKGYNEIFALVDSTYGSGSTYSSVMAYNDTGWQCKWLSGTANKASKCGLISSAYSSYRYYWGADNKVYYIPLQRNLLNPTKVATTTYASSAIHISPWFDAGWENINKLAVSLKVYCVGTSATGETVTVSYRLNHSYDDIASGWITLTPTITSTGETEYSLASGVGVAFKTIQFRFDLARGSTTTNTPDIQYAVLKYVKLLPPQWGWTFTADCTKPKYKGRSAAQLIDALVTAAETETLLVFTFRNDEGGTETYKVKVKNLVGNIASGINKQGEYTVQVIEV